MDLGKSTIDFYFVIINTHSANFQVKMFIYIYNTLIMNKIYIYSLVRFNDFLPPIYSNFLFLSPTKPYVNTVSVNFVPQNLAFL
jgi:hypothetical protein